MHVRDYFDGWGEESFQVANNCYYFSTSTWTIFYFITYEVESNLHDFIEGTWATISGIAFTLITVRIGLGWSTPTDGSTNVVSSLKPPRFAARSAISTGSESFPMHHVVDVSTTGSAGEESPSSGVKPGIFKYTSNSDVTAVA